MAFIVIGIRTKSEDKLKRSLSIVFIADVPQSGGAASCLVEMVDGLVKDWGASCTVLLPSGGPLEASLASVGASTYITGHRAFLVSKPSMPLKVVPKYLIELVRYFAHRSSAVRKANRFVDFEKVDIIHSNLPRNDLGVMLSDMHGIPHVCHLREFSFSHFECWSYRRHPVDYLSSHSRRLISVSKACGEAWSERGVEKRKLSVVYDGVDTDRFSGELTDSGSRDPLSLVFLGGYSKAKGLSDVIEAVGILHDKGLDEIAVDVFGSGSRMDVARAKARVSELGIIDRFSFHGMVEDVPKILPSYDVGLVCSKSEAFGRVVVECWASAVMVVGADRGSLPELLDSGRYGLLYKKEIGPSALADCLQRIICDRELLKQYQLRGLDRAKEFTTKNNVAGIMRVYREVLESRP